MEPGLRLRAQGLGNGNPKRGGCKDHCAFDVGSCGIPCHFGTGHEGCRTSCTTCNTQNTVSVEV